jgi:hypothetical protein
MPAGIRVCALPRRDSGWQAQALRLWSASSWDGAPWGWILSLSAEFMIKKQLNFIKGIGHLT